jgi:hypothetical protein
MKRSMVILGLAVAAFIPFIWAASAIVDLDYSHAIKGSGTLVTDFKMGSELNAEVTGKVRGTGQIVNRYVFLTGNNSDNVTVRDEFQLSEPEQPLPPLASYPKLPEEPLKFKLTGAEWADELEIMSARQEERHAEPQLDPILAKLKNTSILSNFIPSITDEPSSSGRADV